MPLIEIELPESVGGARHLGARPGGDVAVVRRARLLPVIPKALGPSR
ncbi:MAG: hypothetical protein ACUVXB_08410 [Bryobacteraceae bacterium]